MAKKSEHKTIKSLLGTVRPKYDYPVNLRLNEQQALIVVDVAKKRLCTGTSAIRHIIESYKKVED